MNKVAANIVKGLVGRLRNGAAMKKSGELGWLQKKLLKNQDDQAVKLYAFKNFKVSYKRPYELLHTYEELFEKQLYLFQSQSAFPLIVDCGANIGLSTLYFKTAYPQARVIVFEPDASNFQLLSQNCMQNGLQQVELHQAAVWIENGFISFDAKETEGSRIAENSENGHHVKSIRLADLLESETKIDFLKIDIEGAEYEVLKDAAPQLYKVENFFLEYHGKANETYKLNEIFAILKEAGFAVYIKMAADNLHHPFVQKATGTIYDVQLNLFCYRHS